MNLVYLASPIYIIGAILLFMVVVGMLYKLFCINVKESFNEAELILEQINEFDAEDEDAGDEEGEDAGDEEGEDWEGEEGEDWEGEEGEDWEGEEGEDWEGEEGDDAGDEVDEDWEDEDWEPVYCTQCGARFPEGARFCAACGTER